MAPSPAPRFALIADRTRPRGWLLRVGDTDQSYVDLDDPAHLEFDYVQRIADVLDALAPPGARLRTVHVGGGAFTLPRYLTATRPGSAQVVVPRARHYFEGQEDELLDVVDRFLRRSFRE